MPKRGRPPAADVLTPAEWRVVEGVRHGLTNPQIARRLDVSLDAVKYHVANALQKLAMTSRQQLRHWPGINRSSALANQETPMPEHALTQSIGQISRSVRDIQQSESFYRDTLGLPHLYTFGNLAFFDCQGVRLFLSQDESPSSESILYFRTDDIHRSAAELAARNVEFINAPHLVHRHANGTEEWMAFFKDPEGRPLALMAQVVAANTD